MQVSCQSDRYETVMSTAGYGGLAVYAIAPGLLFLAVLWPHRAALTKSPERRTDEEVVDLDPTSFLHASYRPTAWWFESFEIIRRLAMCGGINIWFDQDSTTGRLFGSVGFRRRAVALTFRCTLPCSLYHRNLHDSGVRI